MKKSIIAIIAIVSIAIIAIFLFGNINTQTEIITGDGTTFPATDVGFQNALTYTETQSPEVSTITLPPKEIEIDVMYYITQDNLEIIGTSNWNSKTTLNFVNHTVWYDEKVWGWRACRPYPEYNAGRLEVEWSMKSMEFYKCKNIYMQDITFTGASNLRFVIEENANIHLNNVDFIDIDRPFTHHGDYGSWHSTCAFESDTGTLLSGDVLVENCDIIRSTNWGWVPFIRGQDATMENFVFRNCTAFRCGMPVNGVPIIDWYDNGVRETNNWQNWSIGFGITESYWAPTSLVPTSRNFTYEYCIAEENRESGFHSEYRAVEDNIVFKNCKSNRNGQKWISQGYELGYNPRDDGKIAYSSGWLGFPDDRYDDQLINCEANDNFLYGYWRSGSSSIYETQMTGCTASGNGISDYI